MERITAAAKATYKNSLVKEEKEKMKQLFKSIDKDGDGKISTEELKLYFETQPEQEALGRSNIFSLIDENQDGFLQFGEFVTLFYVILSNIPVCNACTEFTEGVFYVCLDCLDKPARQSYNLCVSCYYREDFLHEHAEFLDNYTLFSDMREKLQGSSSGGTSKAKSRKRDKMKKALKVITGLAAIGSFIVSCPWG
ncbi:hypothetical protein L6164_006057 [Bauhinia variegata]|uniref:Uncharacterized protein n=1 Tax=Bauhinia variegata TaxID=167791 RepID=A0ACB9PSK4_BAUVA|nr:hypothetical protein L6164_006057 [Bauhinia variegata]